MAAASDLSVTCEPCWLTLIPSCRKHVYTLDPLVLVVATDSFLPPQSSDVPMCLPHPQVMQNIGNLTPEVDAKELFMRPMIPFIQESIGRAKQYILDLIQIDQKLGEPLCN